MTLSFCMSPISSGKDSNLLECRNSTVAFFQLPICEGKETKNRELWANKASCYRWADWHATPFDTSTNTHTHSNVHAHLRGKLHKEVVICSKGADADTLADGRGQGFDLIETAVKLVQRCQPDAERSRGRIFNDMVLLLSIQCIPCEKKVLISFEKLLQWFISVNSKKLEDLRDSMAQQVCI